MNERAELLIEGFVKVCHIVGLHDEEDIFELLKQAAVPKEIVGEAAAKKDKENYYQQSGKMWRSHKKEQEIDSHGLPGDPDRTNVATTEEYVM